MKTTTTISIEDKVHEIGKEDGKAEGFNFSVYITQLILRARKEKCSK